MLVTINQLMEMTRKSFRTVKKKIENLKPVREDGRAGHYECHEALEAIYGTSGSNKQELEKETLLHERARREKVEIEVGRLRGELVPVEDVVKAVEKEYAFVRAQIRSLPSKLAKPLSMITDPNEVYERLSEGVNETLTELTRDQLYQIQKEELLLQQTNAAEETVDVGLEE